MNLISQKNCQEEVSPVSNSEVINAFRVNFDTSE